MDDKYSRYFPQAVNRTYYIDVYSFKNSPNIKHFSFIKKCLNQVPALFFLNRN
ncbi:hypothetical protein J506_0637 [Acinetobacter baumannii 625974]|uniref:Uncharacterized protein n=1 Tax=Acinetobacter baumannii 625974 TaxID=1310607 RepID=A0A009PJE7_ACIBA|nr:hypothetical protein J506_0637 [Acinetobacter baumannii 625974]